MTVDVALARRLELAQAARAADYAHVQHRLYHERQATTLSLAGGRAVYAGPDSPVNRAIGLGLEGPVTAADLLAVEAFYHKRSAPPRVDLCPLAHRSLIALLRKAGYLLDELLSVLMLPLPAAELPPPPSDVEVKRCRQKERDLWLLTTAQGFSDQEAPDQETLRILAPNAYGEAGVCFLARIGGEAAGGAAMFLHDGVAELGGAATRPAFRRRGVQSALVRARLIAAHELGCDMAVVVTARGSASQRNLERAGFRLAYTKPVLVAAEGRGHS